MSEQPPPKGKIIVFGILFWYPLAGVTYQFLHYLLGLRRLGYDPYYIEDSARWIYDPRLNDLSPDASWNIETVLPALQKHGFGDRWAFHGKYPDGKCYGLGETQVKQLYREADAFLNITGAQELRDEHLAIKRRIYVESDPFALQIKVAKGDAGTIKMLARHDTLFSFGENLGAPDCGVPTCVAEASQSEAAVAATSGASKIADANTLARRRPVEKFRWLPTRQPVALELWDGPACGGDTFNTITTWHNKGKNIEWRGETWYWTKDREFEKILDLPGRRAVKFELAATVADEVKALLNRHGWLQRNSVEISRDPCRYRDYIRQSRGEFTVARDQYVRPNTGWFSDRSACYLAAGRPVITQETGFSKFLPTGKGLFAFRTMDDILKAVDAIESDYEGNCRAAREIAAEFFATEKVVGSLMDRAGL